MNESERQVLERLESGIPIVSEPFLQMGRELGMDTAEFMALTAGLFEQNIIREISPVFEADRLGYSSTLVAMRVRDDTADEVAGLVSSHPGVTHNYLRDGIFNIWFTLTLPNRAELEKTLNFFASRNGVIGILNLPKVKAYKIRAAFALKADGLPRQETERLLKAGEHGIDPGTLRRAVLALQRNLPLVRRPFAVVAEEAGFCEDELLKTANTLFDFGIIRRYPALASHRKLGFAHNALVVWKIPERYIDESGLVFSGYGFVTHCYRRKDYDAWPYNLYTMMHARDAVESEKNIRLLESRVKYDARLVLVSLKEYKKTRMRYFDPAVDRWNSEHL